MKVYVGIYMYIKTEKAQEQDIWRIKYSYDCFVVSLFSTYG